jgi:uncharacterized protein (DUF58 family)
VILMTAGLLTRYIELVACGVACLAAVASARLTLLVRPELVVSCEVAPSRVTEGTPSRAVLAVTNTGAHRSPPLLAVETFDGREEAVPIPSLAAGASFQVTYQLAAPRRGIYSVGPLRIERSDALRLSSSPEISLPASTLWVHPIVHHLAHLPIGRSYAIDGPAFDRSPRGGEFYSLREYERGNDLRLVHWKASARAGTLMVRNNVVPHEPQLTLVLDTSAAPYHDDAFEHAVRIAASLCSAARDSEVPVLLRTTGGGSVFCDGSGSGWSQLLDDLASVTTSHDDPGLSWLASITPHHPAMSLAAVTGQPRARSLGAVSAVRRRYGTVTVVRVGSETSGAEYVPGVFLMSVESSREFESAWNRASSGSTSGASH